MACAECLNTVCKKLFVSMCDTGIDTGIYVDETGDYTVFIHFNGTVQRLDLALTANENIILANTLNLDYIHKLEIYDVDNTLVDDACYNLDITLVVGVGNNLTPTPDIGAKKIIVVDVAGISFTNSFFGLHTIIEIVTQNQAYIAGVDFTQAGSTITWINDNKFFDGQTILAQA